MCLSLLMEKSWKTIKNFLLLISEKGKGKEKEREGNINQLPLAYTPTGDQTCNLGLCPDWEFEPTTFWFIEQCPTNWASRASAWKQFLNRGSALCFILILNVYLLVLERKRKGEREKHGFVVPLTYAFIGWFLHVPWQGLNLQLWCRGTVL